MEDGMRVKSSLNLASIRRGRVPNLSSSTASKTAEPESLSDVKISRRAWLGMAGGLASASAFRGSVAPDIKVKLSGSSALLRIGRKTIWKIDSNWFGGNPKLHIDEGQGKIRVLLKDALYPGTRLRADFDCLLERADASWHMKMVLAFPGVQMQEDFLQWTAGAANLYKCSAPATLAFGSGCKLSIRSSGTVQFTPDFVYRFEGKRIAALRTSTNGPLMEADGLALGLPPEKGPTLLRERPGCRTLLTIERGGQAWEIAVSSSERHPWQLQPQKNAFNQISLELGLDKKEGDVWALLADSQEQTAFHFELVPEHGHTPEGFPFSLPVRQVRYALTGSEAGEETLILGQLAGANLLDHPAGMQLALSGPPEKPEHSFEFHTMTGAEPALKADTLLHAINLAIDSDACSTLKFDEPPPFSCCFGNRTWWHNVLYFLHLARAEDKLELPLDSALLEITRPTDLLTLKFRFRGIKLKCHKRKGTLIKAEQNSARLLIVELPSQHVAEQAFFHKRLTINRNDDPDRTTNKDEEYPLPGLVKSRLSGTSKLVFQIPGDEPIPYTLANLLDWTQLKQVVSSAATVSGERDEGPLGAPTAERISGDVTAIELPYRLYLSPHKRAGWINATSLSTNTNEAVELWNTRLGVRQLPLTDPKVEPPPQSQQLQQQPSQNQVRYEIVERAPGQNTLRAIWSEDYPPDLNCPPCFEGQDSKPFRSPLERRDRYEFVELTSNFKLKERSDICRDYSPNPIQVERLALSSVGAWLRAEGSWDPPSNIKSRPLVVEEWRHIAEMGRDDYVRVVYKGYLFPFGHKASLVKVTQRIFDAASGGPTAGYLRQSMYIIVREPVKRYSAPGQPNAGREWPYQKIQITTLQTPEIDDPSKQVAGDALGSSLGFNQEVFWPRVNGDDFIFEYKMQTLDGSWVDGRSPLIFLDVMVAFGACGAQDIPLCGCDNNTQHLLTRDVLTTIKDIYNQEIARRRLSLNGQKVAYTPQTRVGDTSLETNEFVIAAELPLDRNAGGPMVCPPNAPNCDDQNTRGHSLRELDQPPFYPRMEKSQVNIPGVLELTGQKSTSLPTVKYFEKYILNGFEDNKGEVYLKITDSFPIMNFGKTPSGSPKVNSDRSGGILAPSVRLVGMSRAVGPVANNGKTMKVNAAGVASVPSVEGALNDIASGNIDPSQYLDGLLEAKILGAITLKEIIKAVDASGVGGILDNTHAPQMIREVRHGFGDQATNQAAELMKASDRAAKQLIDYLDSLPAAVKMLLDTEVRALRAKLSDYTNVSTLGQKIGKLPGIRTALTQLMTKLDALVHDPSKLLRTFFPKWMEQAEMIWNLLLFFRDGRVPPPNGPPFQQVIKEFIRAQINLILQQIEIEVRSELDEATRQLNGKLDEIVAAIINSPEVGRLLDLAITAMDLLDSVRARVRALQSMLDIAQSTVSQLRANVEAALQLPERPAAQIRDQIRQYTAELASHVPQDIPQLSATIQGALQQLETAQTAGEKLIMAEIALVENSRHLISRLLELMPQIPQRASGFRLNVAGREVKGPRDAARQLVALVQTAANTYSWIRNALANPDFDSILRLIAPASGPVTDRLKALQNELQGIRSEIDEFRRQLAGLNEFDRLKAGLEMLRRVRAFASYADKVLFIMQLAQNKRQQIEEAGRILDLLLNGPDGLKATYIAKFTQPLLNGVAAAQAALPDEVRPLLQPVLEAVQRDIQGLNNSTLPDETPKALRTALKTIRELPDKLRDQVQMLMESLEHFVRSEEFLTLMLQSFGLPVAVDLQYDWEPTLQDTNPKLFIAQGNGGQKATLRVTAKFHKSLLTNERPEVSIEAKLANFTLQLLPPDLPRCVKIDFESVSFSSKNGSSPETKVKIHEVKFGEALEFVKKLQEALNPKEGPYLNIQPNRIEAGFRFAFPKLSVGVFSLMNVRIGTALVLPFDGDPCRFRFFFCDRSKPFLLSVGIFGGGGFFALEVDTNKNVMIEGALEFGLVGSISIGFASGSGYVTAGIYFRFAKNTSEVCGYVRAGGHVDVLGLITVSIDAYLSMCYLRENGQDYVYGWAEITIKIEFFFFSLEVTLRTERRFAGGDSGGGGRVANAFARSLANESDKLLTAAAVGESELCVTDSIDWKEYRESFAD